MKFIKTPEEIENLAEGGKKLARVLQQVVERVQPGVTTAELDRLAESLILSEGGEPSFKGYAACGAPPYPATLCTSINDEVVHGIPSSKRVLQEGDVLGLDIGMIYKDLFTDMAVTVPVGSIDAQSQKLIEVTKKSLDLAIAEVKAGAHIGDIGAAVQTYVEGQSMGVVRDLVGHGVGYAVHEDPQIPNFGTQGKGMKLQENMVIALEPMVTLGSWNVVLASDQWTWKTKDGSRSAHFEHTMVVTKSGARVLTTF